MKVKKLLAIVLTLLLVASFAACGAKDDKPDVNPDSEPKNAQEAAALYENLMTQENNILTENRELWEKVFLSANKDSIPTGKDSNYGDFLLDTINGAKDKFSKDELKTLTDGAEKIRDIETRIAKLKVKYPDIEKSGSEEGSSVVVPDNKAPGQSTNENAKPFPAFEGKDLDGNEVKSEKLFSSNAVTVVNLWFTTCSPCVSELPDLEKLNKELSKKGGAVIGINAFTLKGDANEIKSAKDVLAQAGVTYQNVYFDESTEAGKLVSENYAFPTTYVIDRNGNIVGEPLVGAVNSGKQAEALKTLIDTAIAADKG